MKTVYGVQYKLEGHPWYGRQVETKEAALAQLKLYQQSEPKAVAFEVEIRTRMTAEEFLNDHS